MSIHKKCLRQGALYNSIVAICRNNLRGVDIIGHLGGEEFIVLLSETTINQAAMVGNRLLKSTGSDRY